MPGLETGGFGSLNIMRSQSISESGIEASGIGITVANINGTQIFEEETR